MASIDRTKMFLQNIHNHVRTTKLYGVLIQTTMQILTTVSTSNPIPKISKNWNVDGKVTLGKTELQYSSMYCHIVFNITHFSHPLWTLLHIASQKKLRKQTIFNINTHFTIRTTYIEFQTSTTVIWQGNLTADCEIKQHIWQWKAKEDCSVSAVPCVILIIWMTAQHKMKHNYFTVVTLFFWHNPTAPWCTCLTLARYLQLSWQ